MSEPAVPVAESPGSIASELEDLPSPSTSESSTTEEDLQAESDAEREWRESLQQLELLLTMVIVPYFGKYFGRKAAYWGRSTKITSVVTTANM